MFSNKLGEIVKLQNFRIFRKECLELHGVIYFFFISFDFTLKERTSKLKKIE